MAEILLREFLGEMGRRQFNWSDSDCLTICADWILRVTGRDPAAPYRGTHWTKKQARRIARRFGGDVVLAEKAFASVGLPLVNDPREGDVALVLCPKPTGAICVGRGHFAVLSSDVGLMIAPLKFIRAWRVDG